MATTLHASGTQALTVTTEHSVATAIVTGVFSFHVDLNAMVALDVVELRVKQIVLTAGASRVLLFQTYYGAQAADDKIAVSIPIGNDLTDAASLDFTIKQTFGTSRSVPWKVLRYA